MNYLLGNSLMVGIAGVMKYRKARMNYHDPEEIRKCRKCGVEKPLTEFTRTYQYGYVQYKNYCKVCNNKRTQAWRARKRAEESK